MKNKIFLYLQVVDPTGNSFVENPSFPLPDPQLVRNQFERTEEQNLKLGIYPDSGEEKKVIDCIFYLLLILDLN